MTVASFIRIMRPATKQKMVQEWFKEYNEFKLSTWLLYFPDRNLFLLKKHKCNVLRQFLKKISSNDLGSLVKAWAQVTVGFLWVALFPPTTCRYPLFPLSWVKPKSWMKRSSHIAWFSITTVHYRCSVLRVRDPFFYSNSTFTSSPQNRIWIISSTFHWCVAGFDPLISKSDYCSSELYTNKCCKISFICCLAVMFQHSWGMTLLSYAPLSSHLSTVNWWLVYMKQTLALHHKAVWTHQSCTHPRHVPAVGGCPGHTGSLVGSRSSFRDDVWHREE